jgi:hypothetical protein
MVVTVSLLGLALRYSLVIGAADGTLYLGSVKGINKYNGYLDDTTGTHTLLH